MKTHTIPVGQAQTSSGEKGQAVAEYAMLLGVLLALLLLMTLVGLNVNVALSWISGVIH